MISNLVEKEKCCGCYACADACHNDAIQIKTEKGLYIPIIDINKCVGCGMCHVACPVINCKNIQRNDKDTFSLVSKSICNNLYSSSGGVFFELAKHILENGGVVFGAAFTNDFRAVKHIFIKDPNLLYKLQGSKYVKSDTSGIYKIVRKLLSEGKTVLFSGTPCQVHALMSFLQYKKYNHLYTVETICHGTPRIDVYSLYLNYLENYYHGRIVFFNFRKKRPNLPAPYYYEYEFSNNKKIVKGCFADYYGYFFNKDYTLNESCYNCSFKGIETVADLTIGDYWGNKSKLLDNYNSVSTIVLNSEKGKKLFFELKDNFIVEKIDYKNDLLFHNKSLIASAVKPKDKDYFDDLLNKHGFGGVIKRFYKINSKERILYALDRLRLLEIICRARKHKQSH